MTTNITNTTYKTVTEAFDNILGRSRSRYEVENGVTTKEVNGVTVRESVFCKYYNRSGNTNTFNEDFTLWTRTIKKDSRHDGDALKNAYAMGTTFDVVIGGDFESEEVQMKKIRKKVSSTTYRVTEVPTTVKVSHSVCHLGEFMVIDMEESDKEIVFYSKKV